MESQCSQNEGSKETFKFTNISQRIRESRNNSKEKVCNVIHPNPYQTDQLKGRSNSRLPRIVRTTSRFKSTDNSSKVTEDSGDSSPGPSKLTGFPTKMKKEDIPEKLKTSHIPRRKSNKDGSKESNDSIKKSPAANNNQFIPESRNVQRVNMLINPEICPEDPPVSVQSTRPIPTLGQIYGRVNMIDSDRLNDWFMELNTPMNSITSNPRTVNYGVANEYNDCVSSTAASPANCHQGDLKRSTIVLDRKNNLMNGFKDDSVDTWRSSDVEFPTRDNESGYKTMSSKNQPKSIHLQVDSQPVKPNNTYCLGLTSTDISKSSSSYAPSNECSTATSSLLKEQQTVVLCQTPEMAKLKSEEGTEISMNNSLKPTRMSKTEETKDYHCPSNVINVNTEIRNHRAPVPSYTECLSEILQKTTNFEMMEGIESPKTQSSAAATDIEYRDNLSEGNLDALDDFAVVEDQSNLEWCRQQFQSHNNMTFVKSDETVTDWSCRYRDEASYHCSDDRRHDSCHLRHNTHVYKKFCDESTETRERCKKCQRFKRFPSSRYQLPRTFGSWRQRLSLRRICRRRWNHVWKKTAARWASWSRYTRPPARFRRFRVMHYLQPSVIWEDADVQTNTLNYNEAGTDSSVKEQKSTAIGTVFNMESWHAIANKSDSVTRTMSNKSRIKHVNLGPSMFPFLYNSKRKPLTLRTSDKAQSGAQFPYYQETDTNLTSKILTEDYKWNPIDADVCNSVKSCQFQEPMPETVEQSTSLPETTEANLADELTDTTDLSFSMSDKVTSTMLRISPYRLPKPASKDAFTQKVITCHNEETDVTFLSMFGNSSTGTITSGCDITFYKPMAGTDISHLITETRTQQALYPILRKFTSNGTSLGRDRLTAAETQISTGLLSDKISTGMVTFNPVVTEKTTSYTATVSTPLRKMSTEKAYTECTVQTEIPEAYTECTAQTEIPEAYTECTAQTEIPEAYTECTAQTEIPEMEPKSVSTSLRKMSTEIACTEYFAVNSVQTEIPQPEEKLDLETQMTPGISQSTISTGITPSTPMFGLKESAFVSACVLVNTEEDKEKFAVQTQSKIPALAYTGTKIVSISSRQLTDAKEDNISKTEITIDKPRPGNSSPTKQRTVTPKIQRKSRVASCATETKNMRPKYKVTRSTSARGLDSYYEAATEMKYLRPKSTVTRSTSARGLDSYYETEILLNNLIKKALIGDGSHTSQLSERSDSTNKSLLPISVTTYTNTHIGLETKGIGPTASDISKLTGIDKTDTSVQYMKFEYEEKTQNTIEKEGVECASGEDGPDPIQEGQPIVSMCLTNQTTYESPTQTEITPTLQNKSASMMTSYCGLAEGIQVSDEAIESKKADYLEDIVGNQHCTCASAVVRCDMETNTENQPVAPISENITQTSILKIAQKTVEAKSCSNVTRTNSKFEFQNDFTHQIISLSRLFGKRRTPLPVKLQPAPTFSTPLCSASITADQWINECPSKERTYESLLMSNDKEEKQQIRIISSKTKPDDSPIITPVGIPSLTFSKDSLADVFPIKKSKEVYNKVPEIKVTVNPVMVDEINSGFFDTKDTKEVKESFLQASPDICETGTESLPQMYQQKSASVLTTQCVLPSPSPCGAKLIALQGPTECVFVYGEPRCAIHKRSADAAVQMDPPIAKSRSKPRREVCHSVGMLTSLNTLRKDPSQQKPNPLIREVLSPKVYKALYETTKLVVKEESSQPPVISVRDAAVVSPARVDAEVDAAKFHMPDVRSAGVVTSLGPGFGFPARCYCKDRGTNAQKKCATIFRVAKVEETTETSDTHAKLLEMPDDNKEGCFEDCMKTHLVTSCRYYSNLLTKQLGRVKENLTKHLANPIEPTEENPEYTSTEACTMKPSGRTAFASQTHKYNPYHKSARQMSCCVLSPAMSLTDICKHDKDHLKSVYYMLSAIEGRLRRLKLNTPNSYNVRKST